MGCYNGNFLGIEVKVGSDRMSDKQIAFKDSVIKAGGIHFEAKTLDSFLEFWKKQTGRPMPPGQQQETPNI